MSVQLRPEHLADLLAPSLSDARCRDEWRLSDSAAKGYSTPEYTNARAEALALCEVCPCLTACRGWFDSLPPQKRPLGVVAGMVNKRSRNTPW